MKTIATFKQDYKKAQLMAAGLQQKEAGRLYGSGTFPNVILIDTVSFCNLKCAMCVHKKMKRKKGIMKWGLFTKIIDEVAKENKNARVWMVFFGEALLLRKTKPSIFDMIAYAKNRGLADVVLNSNANLMDIHSSGKLINSRLDAIYIGIDAFKPSTYSKIRVGGNYENTIANVINLLKLKRRLKSVTPHIFVQFVEMEVNKGEKNKFVKFWKSRGANVKIRPMVSWAGKIEAPNLILGNQDRWPCYWAIQTMSITDTGKVVTCAVDLDADFIAGDVNENSLKEIWNQKLKIFRNFQITWQFEKLPKNCRYCGDWQSARADYF